MFHKIEPALAARLADEVGAARQQLRHRVVEAAHQRAVNEQTILHHAPRTADTPQAAAATSSLMTRNLTRSIRPKLVVSATSAAARPVAIRMRPIRGLSWRASQVEQRPAK